MHSMTKIKAPKTLAEQVADLDDPAPRDFDPEDNGEPDDSDDGLASDDASDVVNGRGHYVDVGESKLRKRDEVTLGPQYKGSSISRDALLEDEMSDDPFRKDVSAASESETSDSAKDGRTTSEDIGDDEDIDSDAAFGESDLEKFKGFTFRGSKQPTEIDGLEKPPRGNSNRHGEVVEAFASEQDLEELDDVDGTESDDEESIEDGDENDETADERSSDEAGEDEDISEDDANPSDEEQEALRRAELRKMMNEEQKTVVATISQAAKADAEKGEAVKQQRSTFDALLNTRIRLQKALSTTNTISGTEKKTQAHEDNQNYTVQPAEEAALRLWNALDSLRQDLSKANDPTKPSTKRKRDHTDTTTPTTDLWSRMQTHESAFLPLRRTTLEKWSAKVRGATTLPLSQRLNNTTTQQSITSVLDEQLTNPTRLIKRTQVPRSCAPLQVSKGLAESPEIFDDADFYQMLLKELVDQRMVDSQTSSSISTTTATGQLMPVQWQAAREAKTKRNVDTKASKGRKMRYTVHEKLQNFMAPEDRGSWEGRQVDELFGSLLGKRMELREMESGDEGEREDMKIDGAVEEGLRLFRR
ncbi:MAG: rRNA-processing protein bfr2 [Pycnora praestabilis]|nr:MAG: rRNA-processing protein bfr2 [Pycnora praestabilis]